MCHSLRRNNYDIHDGRGLMLLKTFRNVTKWPPRGTPRKSPWERVHGGVNLIQQQPDEEPRTLRDTRVRGAFVQGWSTYT